MHFVGNTMIDTLVALEDRFRAAGAAERLGVEPGELRRSSPCTAPPSSTARCWPRRSRSWPRWRARCRSSSRSTRARGKMMEAIESEHPGLLLCEPLGYLDFLSLLADAGAVLTDSGGIQEETTYLGIPCFTLRDNTERPITVDRRHQHPARPRPGGDRRNPSSAGRASGGAA